VSVHAGGVFDLYGPHFNALRCLFLWGAGEWTLCPLVEMENPIKGAWQRGERGWSSGPKSTACQLCGFAHISILPGLAGRSRKVSGVFTVWRSWKPAPDVSTIIIISKCRESQSAGARRNLPDPAGVGLLLIFTAAAPHL
jgi:hypothetical protein